MSLTISRCFSRHRILDEVSNLSIESILHGCLMSSDCINEGYDVTQVIWIQSLIKSRHHPTLGCLRLLYEPTLLYSMAFSSPPLHLSSTLLLLHSGTNLTSVQVLTLSMTSKTLSGRIMKKTLNPRLFLYI